MNVARALTVLGLIAAACANATPANAQSFPSKPIKIVVPVAPGTIPDILARLLGNHLAPRLGQPIVVENRSGASSNIGAEYVARSEPDGHTLMVAPPPPLAINESLFPKLGFDPAVFVPVTILVTLPNVLVVNAGVKARNVEELVALAKASPDQLNGGSTGVGGTPHLSLEMFKAAAGVSIKHIPYSRGLAPALTDLLAGRIDLMFMNLGDALHHIRSGQLGHSRSQAASASPICRRFRRWPKRCAASNRQPGWRWRRRRARLPRLPAGFRARLPRCFACRR